MKLISCYVKNFGTLSDFSYTFGEGLNSLIADNGSGKSTLAVFIKTMFYGFDGVNKRALGENERKKYTPWKTRHFGGSLDFVLDNNKSYRIERFFEGNESTFKLYDLSTNMLSSDYSENIGVELFGIDREGFERSTYYPQKQVEEKANTTISAKLTSLTHNTNDLNCFDSASKILDDFRKELTSGTYGKIQKLKSELDSLSRKVSECEDAKMSLQSLKEKREVLEGKLKGQNEIYNNVLTQKDSALKQGAQKEINENYQMLERDVVESENALKELEEFFNGKDVANDEISTIKEKLIFVRSCEGNSQVKSANATNIKMEIEEFFGGSVPSSKQVEEIFTPCYKETKKGGGVSKILIALAIVSLVLACGMLFVSKAVAIGAFVLSGVLFFSFMFVYFNSMMKSNLNIVDETKAMKFLLNYFDSIDNIEEAKNIIRAKVVKYEALSVINGEEDSVEYEKTMSEINAFLGGFDLNGSIEEKISLLESKMIQKQNVVNLLNERRQRLENFVSNKKVVAIDSFDLKQIEEDEKQIKNDIDLLGYELARTNNLIEKEQSILENYEGVLEEKLECENKIKTLNEIANDVVLTKEFLQKAKDSLNSRYLGKMQNYYKKYCEVITENVITNAVFDSNLKFSFIYDGEVKDKEYLSEGLKDITDVCSRLALCDALYENEKPMLIFDDPFVNLDDVKLDRAKKLLKEISKNYQIVYLVCHSSRLIK